ncbi:hypothetical protein BKA70DRAFT_1432862 [Coprinopsis sp. MPI-PUGE-AT-0042]|nr:hypothetical protein BKA70DRAFT_1432862 [Coprinopsis sp. MPI-PUGE-AT-0042]
MDGTLKRQRNNHSLGGSTKRARWEAELSSPPSECSPSSLGSLISGTQSAHVSGGTFTIVGRDSITTVHHHYAPATVDILEILNSIPLPNFRNIQLDTYAKATQGTCGWFITGDTFLFWVKNGKILWAVGIPGAGKTILASIVTNYLEQLEEEAAGGSICVAYVYVRYSEPLAARDILESLVRQIIERHVDLVPAAETLYGKHKRERTRPGQQDLLRLLSRFTELGKTLFFVIDAVDEMPSEERAVTLGLLASLDARLFVTSRPLPLLQQCFPMAQMLEVTAHSSDIDLLIQDSLSRHPDLMVLLEDPNLGNHIKQKIRQKSGGMFLHVKLQLEALRHCISIQDAEETVEQFPADIKAIYTKTWERILAQGQKHAGLAKLVLLWILHASGEMTIDQLRHAIATCPSTSHYDARRLVPEPLLISGGLTNRFGFKCDLSTMWI